MEKEGIDLSIVIPVYRSSESLKELNSSIQQVAEAEDIDFEIIFVDDGSDTINTWETLSEIQALNKKTVRCFRLMKNFGRPAALLCGFSKSRGQHILMMDDDLQHNPKFIPKLLEKKDHDVVIAKFRRKKHSWLKKVFSSLKGWFDYKLIHKPAGIQNSSYKLIDRKLIQQINKMRLSNPFISALLFSQTSDIINVDVDHFPRKYGKGAFTFRKGMAQFSNLIFNNSSFLLKIVSYMGISFSFLSFLLGIYYLSNYFRNGIQIKGWTSLILLVLFTSGLILFSLGVFGEYFIRMIRITEDRPSYVIRDCHDILS